MSNPKLFSTIGREREKLHTAKFVKDAAGQALIFPVIDAAFDLNEGHGAIDHFVVLVKTALVEGCSAVWQNAANWMRKIGSRFPGTVGMWEELAVHPDWSIRWRVACVLYHDIPEATSNGLFAVLRHDRSAKVRRYAIDRYENRQGMDGNVVFKMFDADDAASPGFKRG